jgi:hypothetical protein
MIPLDLRVRRGQAVQKRTEFPMSQLVPESCSSHFYKVCFSKYLPYLGTLLSMAIYPFNMLRSQYSIPIFLAATQKGKVAPGDGRVRLGPLGRRVFSILHIVCGNIPDFMLFLHVQRAWGNSAEVTTCF